MKNSSMGTLGVSHTPLVYLHLLLGRTPRGGARGMYRDAGRGYRMEAGGGGRDFPIITNIVI